MKKIFRRFFCTGMLIVLVVIIFQFVKGQIFMSSTNLPDVVWSKCFFTESCEMPLTKYRTDLDWDKLCIKNYQKTENSEPCDYCNVITLQKNNIQVYQQMINLPHREDKLMVHFNHENQQCFERNSTKILARKNYDYGWINYGVEFVLLSK